MTTYIEIDEVSLYSKGKRTTSFTSREGFTLKVDIQYVMKQKGESD